MNGNFKRGLGRAAKTDRLGIVIEENIILQAANASLAAKLDSYSVKGSVFLTLPQALVAIAGFHLALAVGLAVGHLATAILTGAILASVLVRKVTASNLRPFTVLNLQLGITLAFSVYFLSLLLVS